LIDCVDENTDDLDGNFDHVEFNLEKNHEVEYRIHHQKDQVRDAQKRCRSCQQTNDQERDSSFSTASNLRSPQT
jgi:hypothetical protein